MENYLDARTLYYGSKSKKQLLKIFRKMAVPKKRTSKSKKNSRKSSWKQKTLVKAKKALSLGKALLTGRSKFRYLLYETRPNPISKDFSY